jgi:hypothetical protein
MRITSVGADPSAVLGWRRSEHFERDSGVIRWQSKENSVAARQALSRHRVRRDIELINVHPLEYRWGTFLAVAYH